jgi:hypothetical protein
LRCFPGEYVTIADRYKDNPRFKALSNDIGVLTKRHSEGAWFVSFDLTGCKQGFAAGGEGIFHLKYATNGEMLKTMHTVQQMNKDQRLGDEAAARLGIVFVCVCVRVCLCACRIARTAGIVYVCVCVCGGGGGQILLGCAPGSTDIAGLCSREHNCH